MFRAQTIISDIAMKFNLNFFYFTKIYKTEANVNPKFVKK
jgi:hypothetical protein